jgi:hypothetical protein
MVVDSMLFFFLLLRSGMLCGHNIGSFVVNTLLAGHGHMFRVEVLTGTIGMSSETSLRTN